MKADLTRDAFCPDKRFARVLMQQGRVQLDADWNDQAEIFASHLHALAADLIGPAGGPAKNCGFVIQALPAALKVNGDFLIAPGRYYVDGIACELPSRSIAAKLAAATPPQPKQIIVAAWTLDGIQFAAGQFVQLTATNGTTMLARVAAIDQSSNTLTLDQDVSAFNPVSVGRVATYLNQPDLPVAAALTAGSYFAYLDTWERLITCVEDDSIREVALNGADTAARSKTVCQVKVAANPEGTDPLANFDPANRGFLRARALKPSTSTDPCTISPNAQYRGPENQLYRVEIHTGGAVGAAGQAPTFKWSRENGAVVFPIVRSSGTNAFVVESLGRDDRFGLAQGDTVEVQDDDSALLNRADNLLVVQAIDGPNMTVTLTGAASGNAGKNPARHPLLRRWDLEFGDPTEGELQQAADGAALIVEGTAWLDLENGVQIQFPVMGAGMPAANYRTGDYWLIPARVVTGDVIWPSEPATDAKGKPTQSPLALPPQGVHHHYAPLAQITVDAAGAVSVTTPLTKTFSPMAP